MSKGSFVIRMGGESGEGIVTIGEVFVRIAAFSGLEGSEKAAIIVMKE